MASPLSCRPGHALFSPSQHSNLTFPSLKLSKSYDTPTDVSRLGYTLEESANRSLANISTIELSTKIRIWRSSSGRRWKVPESGVLVPRFSIEEWLRSTVMRFELRSKMRLV